ncbi:MAG TPA: hypothetical protein VK032_00510 [Burkholderiaceae bacterium]|nr:hypothetical protein [Burkholderiaceae bacterium]
MPAAVDTRQLRHIAHAIRFEICGESGRLVEAAANEIDALRKEINALKKQLEQSITAR